MYTGEKIMNDGFFDFMSKIMVINAMTALSISIWKLLSDQPAKARAYTLLAIAVSAAACASKYVSSTP